MVGRWAAGLAAAGAGPVKCFMCAGSGASLSGPALAVCCGTELTGTQRDTQLTARVRQEKPSGFHFVSSPAHCAGGGRSSGLPFPGLAQVSPGTWTNVPGQKSKVTRRVPFTSPLVTWLRPLFWAARGSQNNSSPLFSLPGTQIPPPFNQVQ